MGSAEVGESRVAAPRTVGIAERAWDALGTRRALISGVVAVAAFRIWLFLEVGRYAEMRGDEDFYWRSARAMLRAVRLEDMGNESYDDLARRIIGRGFFLPGPSAVLTPARLVSDDYVVGRAWVGLVSFALLLAVVHQVARMFSLRVAVFVLVVIGLLPYTAWFSLTFWGGQIGGLIMVLNLLWAVRMARQIRDGETPGWSRFALLGASVGVCVYIRPTTLGQVLPIAILLFLAYAQDEEIWPAIRRSVARWAAMFGVTVVLLAPWSIALMVKFDGPFFLVTSRPLSEILRNAPDEELDEIGREFGELYDHIVRLAEERDQGFYEVAISERDRLRSDRTTGEYVSQAWRGMQRFYDRENSFLRKAVQSATTNDDRNVDAEAAERLENRLTRLNSWGWTGLTFLTLYALMRRWSLWQSEGWLGIVLRSAMAMALFQPLTGGPHGRHISFLVPLFALSVALALESRIHHDVVPMPTVRWAAAERFVATAFTVIIAGFVAFYFAY